MNSPVLLCLLFLRSPLFLGSSSLSFFSTRMNQENSLLCSFHSCTFCLSFWSINRHFHIFDQIFQKIKTFRFQNSFFSIPIIQQYMTYKWPLVIFVCWDFCASSTVLLVNALIKHSTALAKFHELTLDLQTKTGAVAASLPTSSSICIIFFIRDCMQHKIQREKY
jgi:hypothetical protein